MAEAVTETNDPSFPYTAIGKLGQCQTTLWAAVILRFASSRTLTLLAGQVSARLTIPSPRPSKDPGTCHGRGPEQSCTMNYHMRAPWDFGISHRQKFGTPNWRHRSLFDTTTPMFITTDVGLSVSRTSLQSLLPAVAR
ncbi:predicted protein [Pyrenophora tritici-repentis Pt-1C-BFP]|uniref:Uncharacterized protein n=1 Tax=Pyrenophora tritici-repentis (strain Pt-1C-BFP) TaxID=426418 RepID=B2WN72_PYRTR|nr:uncharacterized protein PTRG_11521 [Pyrenophora tritici-repentis Pt-1C-BFP]EDU44571.1 predicted protein [Pyrenophora tritici-repentis Pt-1C-BFP]